MSGSLEPRTDTGGSHAHTRAVGWGGSVLLGLAGLAAAQPPLLELSRQVVLPGTNITITVLGPPLHFFGVAISSTNSGLSGGGFDFELGPEFTVIGSGQLDADGRATFPFPVPPTPSPLFVQGATSPDPEFNVFVPTAGKAITVGGRLFSGNTQSVSSSPGFAGVDSTGLSAGGSQAHHLVSSLIARECLAASLHAKVEPSRRSVSRSWFR
ncbi:MAG: hypothetical protein ACREMB_14315 [Candidatus Rokuibacteriota bacterium]